MSLSNYDVKSKIRTLIANDEGFSGKIYTDNKGFLTIGYGFNITTGSIPISVAMQWLDYLINGIYLQLEEKIAFWNDLNDARKYVLANMAYQMGIGGLLGFRDMLKALGNKDYITASLSMKDSVWYKEFTSRASRLIKIMQSGEF
jgi:lysozyme